jgi:mRNA-degrading endonuclease RelE of RelBE toxin-antitoxin system
MSFNILTTEFFERELKHLTKKYPSIQKDLSALAERLLLQPMQGTAIGQNCYKIRLSITSKGKGKSGGARVITHVYVTGKTIYLLSIYDKSESETISDKEILIRLKTLDKL